MKAFKHSFMSLMPSLKTNDVIKFYDRYDDYYEFTNFHHHPVRIDEHMWPTTEHYFQAQKFVGTPYYDHIRRLPFPRDAFKVSRDPEASRWVRQDWSSVKDDVMLKALRVKFSDDDLKRKLLETGKKKLVEHTSNDSYWGDGGDGKGRNRLGELLMKVRDELKSFEGNGREEKATNRMRRSSSFSSGRNLDKDETFLEVGKFGTPTPRRKSFSNSQSCKSKTDDQLSYMPHHVPSSRRPSNRQYEYPSEYSTPSLPAKSASVLYGSHCCTNSSIPSRGYNIINHEPLSR